MHLTISINLSFFIVRTEKKIVFAYNKREKFIYTRTIFKYLKIRSLLMTVLENKIQCSIITKVQIVLILNSDDACYENKFQL